jgi:hypothetical protein
MKVSKEYLRRYMPEMILDQISEDYDSRGYEVKRNALLDGLKVDLVAKKNGETILVEVKSDQRPLSKDTISQLNSYAKAHAGHKVLIAVASPPERKSIEITNIEGLLSEFVQKNPPQELTQLSTHIFFEPVSDVEISDIKISSPEEISITGTATLNARLQFGSGSDLDSGDGHESEDSFNISFNLLLGTTEGNGWKIVQSDQNRIVVDRASLYEELGELQTS